MFTNRTLYWIAIDIANQAGYDKLKFEDRVKVVEENMESLRRFYEESKGKEDVLTHYENFVNSITNPITINDKTIDFTDPDSEWGFKNAVDALFKYIDEGYAAHMVYLDASNQALQLYAVVTRDKKTASTCNIANGDDIADAYQLLADGINQRLGSKLTRGNCKKSLMTTMYSKMDAWQEIVTHMYPEGEITPAQFEADQGYSFDQLKQAFEEALIGIAPKAILAMEKLLDLNDENKGTYYWTLPDGFRVRYDVKSEVNAKVSMRTKYGYAYNGNFKVESYGASLMNRGMAPNIIHSIDGYIAREMIRRMNGRFITTIHDAFACHPMDADLMVRNYREILCELLKSDIINDIVKQIDPMAPRIEQTNDLTCKDIMTSTYLLS